MVADTDVVFLHARHEFGAGDAFRQHDLEQVPVGVYIIFWRQLRAAMGDDSLAVYDNNNDARVAARTEHPWVQGWVSVEDPKEFGSAVA